MSFDLRMLAGGLIQGKPNVPKFTPVDINKMLLESVAGNAAALPSAEQLASAVDTFSQAELDKMNEQALPGYANIRQKVGANISDQVNGIIPQAVMDNIARATAGQSVYGGFGGSGRQMNLTGGAFANETYNRMDSGAAAAQKWLASAKAPQFDVTSMFISPTTRLQAGMQQNEQQWNQKWLSSQMNAQVPGPLKDYTY